MAEKGGCFCDKVPSPHLFTPNSRDVYLVHNDINYDQIRVSYTGEANAHVLCHCLDCRKISGGSYSNNFLVPEENFKVESGMPSLPLLLSSIPPSSLPSPLPPLLLTNPPGTPKQISKTADTGKKITSHFCGE